jgi:hypothetical protein
LLIQKSLYSNIVRGFTFDKKKALGDEAHAREKPVLFPPWNSKAKVRIGAAQGGALRRPGWVPGI